MARIRVRLQDGREGTIDDREFDPQSMTNLDSQSVKTVASKALGGLTDFLIPETKKEGTKLLKGENVDLGDAARVALELGSFAIPFGKGAGILGKAILPGAGVGLARGLSQEQKTPESVLASTAVGGATAGIVNPLLDKVLGIGKGASTLGSKMAAPKVKLPYSVFAPEEEQVISQTLLNKGMKGSSANQYAQLPQMFKDITKEVDDVLSQSKISIAPKNWQETLAEKLKLAPYEIDDTYSQSLLSKLNKNANGDLTAQSFNEFKKTLNKVAGLKNIFRKANNELGGALTPKEQTALALWETADDMVRQLAPEAKELTLTQSYLMRAAPSLGKEASKNLALSPLGIPTGINLNRPISATTNAVGRGVGAVGTGLDKVLNPVRQGLQTPVGQQALTQTAVGMGNMPEQPQPLEANPQQSGAQQLDPQVQQLLGLRQQLVQQAQQAQGGGKPTKEQFQQLVLQDLQKTGGKNISKIAAASKFFEPEGQGKLPSAAQNRLDLGTTLQQSLDEVKGLLDKDPSILTKQLVPGQFFTRDYDSATYLATDMYLRITTGAAAPEQEVRRAQYKLFPTFGDSSEVTKQKLRRLEDFSKRVVTGSQNIQEPTQSAPSGEDQLYQLLGL